MVKQFTVGFSRTVNLGNFESARVEASVVVENDADVEAIEEAQTTLRRLLEKTWEAQFKPKSKEIVIARA